MISILTNKCPNLYQNYLLGVNKCLMKKNNPGLWTKLIKHFLNKKIWYFPDFPYKIKSIHIDIQVHCVWLMKCEVLLFRNLLSYYSLDWWTDKKEMYSATKEILHHLKLRFLNSLLYISYMYNFKLLRNLKLVM